MLDVITESLLEGVELDYSNHNQRKYYPYFEWNGSSFRFFTVYYSYWYMYYGGGARHSVDTEEKAKYLGTQFIAIFNKLLNPKK